MSFFDIVSAAGEKSRVENGVKGLACAVFTESNTLWKGLFGQSTYGYDIDSFTLFGVQSISKNFTALAVLMAQSQGLISLDKTVKHYLPDFHVNSAFEEHPEEKITIQMLLTHTAGFTHEAPVGNNYDFTFNSYAQHLESIKDTWLKFPVGSEYSYSNLGYDLLAQISEKVTSMKYSDYLKKTIFKPLGMESTTSDDREFMAVDNKTEGIIDDITKPNHYPIPLIGSGCVYSCVEDMIKYARFYMAHGKADGQRLIPSGILDRMYTSRFENKGFGLYIAPSCDSYLVGSSGGGFGYGSNVMWFPEYQVGCVVLGNKPGDYFTACQFILESYIRTFNPALKEMAVPVKSTSLIIKFPPRQNLAFDRAMAAMDSVFQPGWERYCGKYMVIFSGREFTGEGQPWIIDIGKRGQELWMGGVFGESQLRQYRTGLFFTKDGEALDLRRQPNTYRNIHIVRV